jgi:type IV pilus assembly protein PilC
MATAPKKDAKKDAGALYAYSAKDKRGRIIKGEMRALGKAHVASALLRQNFKDVVVKKQSAFSRSKKITEKDIMLFTRQLATMMKSGVPLLQSFDIVGKGHSNPAVTRLLMDIKGDIESGTSMSAAFAKHPKYFDKLYCNLIQAGEQAGILEDLLDRLAVYKEKSQALKSRIKSALFYPISILTAAFIITAVIMIFVVPAFKELFGSFGADLPAPTQVVIAMSDFFVSYWYAIFGGIGGGVYGIIQLKKKSVRFQNLFDRWILKMPLFGDLILKGTVARWTRTLSTMFAAGVPLVEALDSVAGAAGNVVYANATRKIQKDVSEGISLTVAMQATDVFPNMVLQMVSIGEESGALDGMLSKVADFYEGEVDDMVDALASLMEPIIMAVLGVVIGGLIIAMYLPIFKMGQVVK